ncbi:phage holin family protein [Prauserella shujinwangii]|uniref:phage holin family protein n=1 Tax=Prauserella shujinwangii TaxID=1453103 RepID=UPI0015E60525|nr:phage holin family protein [Prauserella shujinwangii]
MNELPEQVGRLVRDELRLAIGETRAKARQAGFGGGLLAGAAVLGLYGGAALIAALVLPLARRLPPWLAALLAGTVLSGTAAALAALGVRGLREIDPVPQEAVTEAERTAETLRESVETR